MFCLLLWPLWAGAGIAPSGCTDLSTVAETPSVDFASRIQPIFNNNGCVNCHGGNGNLYLDPGSSYNNLVGVPASAPVPVNRVQPGQADQSFLFWKVNCDDPASGSRMPIGGSLTPAEQALIRDWINQGALPAAAAAPTPVPGPSPLWLAWLILAVTFLAWRGLRRA